ncbi:Transmembrane protein, putative [Arachis hypogaea]|nr:Transmembrane protein, putative [Arachis hypogaea]
MNEISLVEDIHNKEVNISISRIKPTRRIKMAATLNQRKLSKFVMRCSCRLKYNRHSSIDSPASSDDDEEFFNSTIPCHAIFIFLDSLLLGMLQLEYQNKNKSPWVTNSIQIQTFLMAGCIYCAVLGIKIFNKQARGGYKGKILSFVLLIFGSISCASLLSIMLHPILLWTVLIIWGSILIILMDYHTLKSLMYWIFELFLKLNRYVIPDQVADVI